MIVMRFRASLIAIPLFALAAPVAAQDVVFVAGTGEADPAAVNDDAGHYHVYAVPTRDTDEFSEMADRIGNPAIQDSVSTAVERATGAMMEMNIGRFAQAIERARPGTVRRYIRSDATIGDLAGRDARYLPEELGERSREAMGMMSGFARAMAVMMPEFERMGREMEESFRAAKEEAGRTRY
jgi:hypothetical protein